MSTAFHALRTSSRHDTKQAETIVLISFRPGLHQTKRLGPLIISLAYLDALALDTWTRTKGHHNGEGDREECFFRLKAITLPYDLLILPRYLVQSFLIVNNGTLDRGARERTSGEPKKLLRTSTMAQPGWIGKSCLPPIWIGVAKSSAWGMIDWRIPPEKSVIDGKFFFRFEVKQKQLLGCWSTVWLLLMCVQFVISALECLLSTSLMVLFVSRSPFRIGLCGFDNPMRDAKTAELKRQIGQVRSIALIESDTSTKASWIMSTCRFDEFASHEAFALKRRKKCCETLVFNFFPLTFLRLGISDELYCWLVTFRDSCSVLMLWVAVFFREGVKSRAKLSARLVFVFFCRRRLFHKNINNISQAKCFFIRSRSTIFASRRWIMML